MREARGSRRRRPAALLAGLAAAVVAVGVACGGTTSTAARPGFSTALSAGDAPYRITSGPDGNLWFTVTARTSPTEAWGNTIGRITPTGAITEFRTGISAGGNPRGITVGPDGNLWFTELEGNRIGRITPNGTVTEFRAGISPNSGPAGITAGPDGNLWFTESGGDRIGRITPTGTVTEFRAGIAPHAPRYTPTATPWRGIAAGPDGNLWFTEPAAGRIGRITPTGTVTEFSTGIGTGSGPWDITAGPDGNLWFTELDGNRIGRITPTGTITEFRSGISAGSGLRMITAGPDGNLWFTEWDGDRIGRITPTGTVTQFRAGISAGSAPEGITAGPDGNLWFTEWFGGRIGRITPAGVISEYPPTAAILAAHQRGTRAVAVRVGCPSGAARECRGTLRLLVRSGPNDRQRRIGGVPRFTLAPGRRAEVIVPLWAGGRRELRARGRLRLSVELVPSAHSTAGAVQRDVVLRMPAPAAVTG